MTTVMTLGKVHFGRAHRSLNIGLHDPVCVDDRLTELMKQTVFVHADLHNLCVYRLQLCAYKRPGAYRDRTGIDPVLLGLIIGIWIV